MPGAADPDADEDLDEDDYGTERCSLKHLSFSFFVVTFYVFAVFVILVLDILFL